MDAPERIALRWELGAAVTSGPLMTHPDYTQYIRADLAPDAALVAELLEALATADDALTEAEAILGGEYGDFYGPLCETMLKLRRQIEALRAKTGGKP